MNKDNIFTDILNSRLKTVVKDSDDIVDVSFEIFEDYYEAIENEEDKN